MRIALLIDWHLYYTVGLANALSFDHRIMLVTRDHNLEISSPQDPVALDDFLKETVDPRIEIERLRFRRNDLRSGAEIVRLRRALHNFGAEVLHVQENTDWRIAALALSFRREKLILTLHDVLNHPGESRGWQARMHNILIRRADRVITHGEYLKRQLISMFPAKSALGNVAVIPHGAYTIFRTWATETPQEKNTILFFGRLGRYKGLDVLIRAQPLISREIPGAKIIIAGQGEPLAPYIAGIADPEAFEIHNRFIPHRELPAYFQRATLVALPYLEASQSGVLALAYAFGKPVVATSVGSLPEAVADGETGFIVPPNDPAALAGAVVKLLREPELAERFARAAARAAETRFSWKSVAHATAGVYAS